MRIMEYPRELTSDGFLVVGSDRDWHASDISTYKPIKMQVGYPATDGSCGISLEEMIELADSHLFHSKSTEGAMISEFCKNYPDIMRGNLPDWHLGAFRVSYGGIRLYYGNCLTCETGFLWIVGAPHLRLTFELPCLRSGFVPTYVVEIDCADFGWSNTKVKENLEHVRQEIRFEIKDHTKKTNIFHTDNQLLHITEYLGI